MTPKQTRPHRKFETPPIDASKTCPKTGHVVPIHEVPTGTVLTGSFKLYDDKGKVIGQGNLEDLVTAETATVPTDSEEA